MNMGALLLSLIVGLGSASAGPWEQTRKEDGITVFKRELPGTDLISFKGVGVINAPVDLVLSVILDPEQGREWMKNVRMRKVLKTLDWPTEYIEYNHVGMPWPADDRDFVNHVRVTVNPKTFEAKVLYSPTKMRVGSRGPLRGDLSGSYYILRPIDGGRRTRAIGVVVGDPKGVIPDFVVNFYQRNWPYDTLMALRRQVKKPKARVPTHLAPLFMGLHPPSPPPLRD